MEGHAGEEFLQKLIPQLSFRKRRTVKKIRRKINIDITSSKKTDSIASETYNQPEQPHKPVQSQGKLRDIPVQTTEPVVPQTQSKTVNLTVSQINQHIDVIRKILILEVHRDFQRHFAKLASLFKDDLNLIKDLSKIVNYFTHQTQKCLGEGEKPLDKSLQQEFIKELTALPSLEQFYVHDGDKPEKDRSIHSLLDSLKEDIKKGNRANFKGLQELETKFEEFVEAIRADKQEMVREAVAELKDKNNDLKNLALEMFDLLDSVNWVIQELGNDEVTKQVEKVVDNALQTLDSYGLEEIEVMGKRIDGKTMISLGNVSREKYAPHLEQYHVYSVTRRGFRDKETKEVIRKATVITVD